MNNTCWYCEDKIGTTSFQWEVPCGCGALNFVKTHASCFFGASGESSSLDCRLCDKPLDFSKSTRNLVSVNAAVRDEEDIT